MDYPLSVTVLRARFQQAVQQDDFSFNHAYDTEFRSVRALIRYLAAVRNGSPVFKQEGENPMSDDSDITIGELMLRPISHESTEKNVSSLVLDRFCSEPLRLIAQDCLRDSKRSPIKLKMLFKELGVSSGSEWVAAVTSELLAEKISILLFADFLAALQHRTLYSFFLVPESPNEFCSIGYGCRSGAGIPLKSLVGPSKSGTVTVTVSRYNEDVCTDAVMAYEWYGTLRSSGRGLDEAAACGMVYIFRGRDKCTAIGDRTDLIAAADAIADTDVLQVHGFLTQNVDAELLLHKSDLCFVWLWERRHNAHKGLGAECLRTALELIQKRFKHVGTVVFNIKPLQFVEWEEANELPRIVAEKRTATESVMAYVQNLNLRKFDVRFVHASEVGNGQAAHFAIADEFKRSRKK